MRRVIFTVFALIVTPGCKPEKPDIIESRREAAEGRLAGAQLVSNQVVTQERLSDRLPNDQANLVVATIGEKTITVADIVRHIDNEGAETRALYMIPQNRRALVKQMIEKELMVAEAEKEGLGRLPIVQQAWKKAMVLEYLRQFGSKMTIAEISDADARAVYDANKSRYQTREKRRASVLIVGTKPEVESIREELLKAIGEAPVKARQIFEDFVRRYTRHEATKLVNGNLGWFDKEGNAEDRRIPPEAGSVAQAFDLTENAVSEAFISEGGYALLQVTGIRPATTRAFDEVKLDIKLELLTQRKSADVKAMIADIVAKANVTIDEAALRAVSDATKASLPNPPGKNALETSPHGSKDTEKASERRAPTPKGVPHPMLLKRPNVTSPNVLRGTRPIDASNHGKKPEMSREEIRQKMGGKSQ